METTTPNIRPEEEGIDLVAVLQRYRPKGVGMAKYVQLAQTLQEAIEQGLWEPGDKLPAEMELAASTSYSLGTVQSAYRMLVEEGMVVRIHGNGTFVADGRHRMDAPWHCRFFNDDGTGFLPVYTKVVSRTVIAEQGAWSKYLGQTGKDIVRIDRSISINDEFKVYSKFFVRLDWFGALLDKPAHELDGMNFKLLLSREFGTSVTRLHQTLSVAHRVPPEIGEVLGLGDSAMAAMLEVCAATSSGQPVYYQEFCIPPSPRRLCLDDALCR